jgi:putative hydrolase of the HAD superfamily
VVRAILMETRSLLYGPSVTELLSEILQGEGIGASPAEVQDALERLTSDLQAARTAVRTEEMENDYHRALLPALLVNLGVPFPTDALLLRLVESVYQYSAYWSMYPETLPVLAELKRRGLQLAVVSNWAPSLPRFISDFALESHFETLLASTAIGVAKPDPFLFHRALKQLGVCADEALHVGPSLMEDVAGAMSAGIRPVWLNRTGVTTGQEVVTITDLRGLLLLVGAPGEVRE